MAQTRRPLGILGDRAGSVAIIIGIVAPVLIGAVGLGVDIGMYYHAKRDMQNAADAAALAAAVDGTTAYDTQAKAVAASYGFVNGANGITVTAADNQTCPDGDTDCYLVNVKQAAAPVYFASVLGLRGPAIASAAMASGGVHSYCLLALGTAGKSNAIDGNGAPDANMNGCSIMSDKDASCSGHNLGATYGDAAGTNNGCGTHVKSGVPKVADPYSSLASNIPANPCGGAYYYEPAKNSDPPLTHAANLWSGTKSLTGTPSVGNGIVCGDLELQGDVTVTSTQGLAGSVLVVENGVLDTHGHRLQTAAGSALTIIFTGDPTTNASTSNKCNGPNHFPCDDTNSGFLDFMAPTSGTWKGIAFYQDPNLTKGIDFTYAGNNPTWNITGAVYFPKASVAFKGAINKSSNGVSCLLFVVGNVTMSGTASIEQTTAQSCLQAGVSLPTNNTGGIVLVE